ncbi:MAG: hypothetical protein ABIC04_06215 [Nanoarchaeota archaeon]
MKIENYFLRYAFPCAYIIMQKGEIDKSELAELEKIAVNNSDISRNRLEKIFHRAFDHIKELAKIMDKDAWDQEVIKQYFRSYHNKIIEQGKGAYATAPQILKELSKVNKATIISQKDDILKVEFENKKRYVLNHFVPTAKVNDEVYIHYGYAVELAR